MEYVLKNASLKQQPIRFLFVIVVGVLVLLIYRDYRADMESVIPESLRDVLFTSPIELTELDLTDHDRKDFGLPQLTDRWTFLFFGYTHCPDICPATLSQMAILNQRIMESTSTTHPQFVFVSVDPQRDSIDDLAEYIGYFDVGFRAVTGESDNITALEKQLGISHQFEEKNAEGDYAVTHSAEIFLVGPKATILGKFRPPLHLNKVVEQYQEVVDYFSVNTEKT